MLLFCFKDKRRPPSLSSEQNTLTHPSFFKHKNPLNKSSVQVIKLQSFHCPETILSPSKTAHTSYPASDSCPAPAEDSAAALEGKRIHC